MRTDLDIILEDWETTLGGINLLAEQTQVILNCVERTLEWWKITMTIPTATRLDDKIYCMDLNDENSGDESIAI
jgi:hypothetical protein